MNERDDHNLTPPERAARDAVRELSRPRADDLFRAKLRHEFVTGGIGARQVLRVPRPWYKRGILLAPLAACFVLASVLAANRGPDWRVVSVDGAGRVVVDRVSFAPSDGAAIAARLKRGGRVEVQGAVTLDLVAPGVAAVALAPGSITTLGPAPNRWWWRGMRAQLAAGDAYFSTGRGFHGAHLDVYTSDVNVRAVGTSFAVLCLTDGTCVCVMEGRVKVGARGTPPGEGVEVPQGMRRTVHSGHAAETHPILDDSVHRLHRQLATVGGVLGR